MEAWTDRIAAISLPAILLLLAVLTAMRVSLRATRIAALVFLADLCESAILAIALVFLVLRPFVMQSYYIPSGSMHPTLQEGDHLVVNKWLYRSREPQRGEVVVFRAPVEAAPDEKEFIKRVIALPGDTIQVREGFIQLGDQIYTRAEIRAVLCNDSDNQAPLRLNTDAIWLGARRIAPEEFAALAQRPGASVRIQPGLVLRNGQPLMEPYVCEDAQYHMEPLVVPPGHLFVLGDNRNRSHDSHYWGPLPLCRLIGRAECVFWPIGHIKRIE